MFRRLDFMTFKILYFFIIVIYLKIEKINEKNKKNKGVFGSTVEKMIDPKEYEVLIINI